MNISISYKVIENYLFKKRTNIILGYISNIYDDMFIDMYSIVQIKPTKHATFIK